MKPICHRNCLPHIVNAQKLEDLRRKYCTTRVMENFYSLVKGLIHDTHALIYNIDETSVCANAKGKIIVPKGKSPYISEDKLIGHITACLTCNAAGEALKPLIILPTLVNLQAELKDFEPQCIFCTSPSGWMTSHIFLIWSIFFTSEVNERRKKLAASIGNIAYSRPCYLFVDDHKSRLNAYAIEILFRNNIRVIVLPAHSSHIMQSFDIGLAHPLKNYFNNLSKEMPMWMKDKLKFFRDSQKKIPTCIKHYRRMEKKCNRL